MRRYELDRHIGGKIHAKLSKAYTYPEVSVAEMSSYLKWQIKLTGQLQRV